MEILGDTVKVLEKALDLRMVNQRVIASNLANIDTPGYQASRLDFEASMERAIAQIQAAGDSMTVLPDAGELGASALGADASTSPMIEPTGEPPAALDGNNVNMEAELGKLGENATMYRLTAQMLSSKVRQLKMILDKEG